MPMTIDTSLQIVVLAAGQGKRMRSTLPKVLQPLASRPLLAHVLDTAAALAPVRTVVVYGHGGEAVREAMSARDLAWAEQAGLDEHALLELINTSSGQNWFASHFDDIEFARDGFDPENTIGILIKDIDSALDAAPTSADMSLPNAVQTVIARLRPKPTA